MKILRIPEKDRVGLVIVLYPVYEIKGKVELAIGQGKN